MIQESDKQAITVFERERLIRSSELSMAQTFLLLTISSFYGRNESAWPGHATLADMMNASPRAVRKWITELEDLKILKVAHGGGRGRSNRYEIDFEALPKKVARHATFDTENMAQDATLVNQKRGTPFPKRGTLFPETWHSVPGNISGNISRTEKGDRSKKFVKPSVQEVKAYAVEIDRPTFDADNFVDHYESNGWRVGKNPMKDWKATVRKWCRTSFDRSGKSRGPQASEATERAWKLCLQSIRRHSHLRAEKIRDEVGDRAFGALKAIGLRAIDESKDSDQQQHKEKFIEHYQTDEVAA